MLALRDLISLAAVTAFVVTVCRLAQAIAP